ncbi:MAG: Hint domain-containing protein [Pseudomonadota bacterium]
MHSKDHGFVPLRAIRKSHIGKVVLGWNPDVRPVVVPTGVLGNWKPLHLSPAHRVLIEGSCCELLFESSEVFVPARQLVGHAGVTIDMSERQITYFHLLFDTHEIVQSDGCWSESLFLGDVAHSAVAAATGWHMEDEVCLEQMTHLRTARPVLRGMKWRYSAIISTLPARSRRAPWREGTGHMPLASGVPPARYCFSKVMTT